ncbi:MAG: protein disulfide isomerase family protein [Archaeoglobaceae archaeon]
MARKRIVLTSTWILLLIVLAVSVSLTGCSQNQQSPSEQSNELSAEEAETEAIDYVNNNLIMDDSKATAVSVEDDGSVYKVVASYQGEEVPLYISKDGQTLYLRALNLSESGSQEQLSTEDAGNRTINYINNNLVEPGTKASAVSVEERTYVYEVLTEYQGKQQPVHISKDGRYLLFEPLNTSEELQMETPVPTETATQPPYSTEELQQFVDCLEQEGMKIYGAETCGYCQDLVNMLGGYDVVDSIYVECTENQQLCQEKGIEVYPTIIIDGSEYQGARSYQAFSQATGCQAPQQ